MTFISRLLEKNGFLLFFLLLQIISLSLIFTRNALQQSWLAAQMAGFNSWVSGYVDEGTSYLKLKEDNAKLVAQNKALLTKIYGPHPVKPSFRLVHDTLGGGQIYTIVDGDVVYNSINRENNYFTINRGRRDGLHSQMGVIGPNGIAGIVINTTNDYALVRSVLSEDHIKINAALKNSGYFGTLAWRGDDSRVMHLSDVPRYVPLAVGDTVITDGKSSIFPRGVMIGRVAGYEVDTKSGAWDISVELSEKMGNLSKIYVVKNMKKAAVQRITDTLQTTIKKDNDK